VFSEEVPRKNGIDFLNRDFSTPVGMLWKIDPLESRGSKTLRPSSGGTGKSGTIGVGTKKRSPGKQPGPNQLQSFYQMIFAPI
jgi:hypothetical protein